MGGTGVQALAGEEHHLLGAGAQFPHLLPEAWCCAATSYGWHCKQGHALKHFLNLGWKTRVSCLSLCRGLAPDCSSAEKENRAGHRDGRASACCPVKQNTFKPFQGRVPNSTGIITLAFSLKILKLEASLSFPPSAFCQMTPIWSHNPDSFFKNQENPNVTWP